MTSLRIPGKPDESLKQLDYHSDRKIIIREAVRVEATRDATVPDHVIQNVKDDEVIELAFEDGIRHWVTGAEFKKEFGGGTARGATADEIIVPGRLAIGTASRGFGSWVLKSLRIFNFDPVAKSANAIAKHYDNKLVSAPGLFRFESPTALGEQVKASDLPKDNQVLIFIHGTASTSTGGFGKLSSDVWRALRDQYGDHIYAFEHHTLSVSPIQNALDLARALPPHVQLDLVSHSRGGLVGELLCRGTRTNAEAPFDDHDRGLLKGYSAEIQQKTQRALGDLGDELSRKQIDIKRFVRVACPAGGTTLASGRVDRWLEVLVNVFGKITGLSATPIYGVLSDFMLDAKKQTLNADAMPGLEAMVPTSPVIRMLNRSDVKLTADLSVIAGDIEGSGVIKRIAVFFTNLFYLEQHDLVVHTRAMYGGGKRVNDPVFYFDQGPEVDHFHYFANKDTADRVMNVLQSERPTAIPAGFRSISETVRASATREVAARSYQKRSGVPQPVVFVLPGIMGSHLSIDTKRIWLNPIELLDGKMADLNIDADDVQADALIARAYGDVIEYLSGTHEVIPFPYDWRISIVDEARRLGDDLDAKLDATDQPVRILAHSMGGLVARAMFAERPELWDKFKDRAGSRFVMLGTPNSGSFTIPRVVLGRELIVRQIALLDLSNSLEQLLEVISRFDGLLQLLPADNGDWNFADADTWKRLKNADAAAWTLPDESRLKSFAQFRKIIDNSKIDADRMLYVAGCARQTPVDIRIDAETNTVRFICTDEGDGRVPWRSGPPQDAPVWYMNAAHGDLADHREAFPALYELLHTGQTDRLSRTPPRVSRAADRFYELPEVKLEIYPELADLEDAALGRVTEQAVPTAAAERIRVSVAHGNFCFCNTAIAVGHYEGDGLYSAERSLDHYLDAKLSHRHRLGLYPGSPGTVEVVLNLNKKPAGAIIVGLGKFGELSPRKLSDTFTTALLQYAVKSVEIEKVSHPNQSRFRLQFSTLFVGSGAGGIELGESIGAILNGVKRANQSLAAMIVDNSVRFEAVQFVELYKDRAVQAVKELKKIEEKQNFAIQRTVEVISGGRRRVDYAEPAGYWSRVNVRSRDDALLFTALSKRARAEETKLAVQRRNIDCFVEQAVNDTGGDQLLTAAMFELLIPLPLKGFAREQSNIVLVVDDKAARYPWELLYDRQLGVNRPLVVEVGLVRQLTTTTFRQQPVETTEDAVFVVGEPEAPEFAPLPGARQEAESVAQRLRESKFEVADKIGADAVSIMTNLMAKDYRVLHLAGHGVYRFKRRLDETTPHDDEDQPKEVTGMVLGDGIFLTAAEIGQMRQVPELVFLNCCHLGEIGSEQKVSPQLPCNEFAASVSKEFIKMGVRAVVCAGWAVDDAAALTFADIFYERMLRGETFGEAVQAARRTTFDLHGDRTNTWGAYQCYGDPTYVLKKRDRGEPEVQIPDFADAEEVVVELDNLASEAGTASGRDMTKLQEKLDKLANAVPAEWDGDALIDAALGRAYGEVYDFEKAVWYYDRALKRDKAFASIRTAEQRANLNARAAVQLGDSKAATEKIRQSIRDLEALNAAFADTAERWSLIGSSYKRLAQVSGGDKRAQALEQMATSYDEAYALKPSPYPRVNALLARTLKYLVGSGRKPKLQADFDAVWKRAVQEETENANFWSGVGVAHVKLAMYLFDGSLPEHIDELAGKYKATWKRFGSARELRSVTEDVDVLLKVLRSEGSGSSTRKAKRKELCAALDKLSAELAGLIEH